MYVPRPTAPYMMYGSLQFYCKICAVSHTMQQSIESTRTAKAVFASTHLGLLEDLADGGESRAYPTHFGARGAISMTTEPFSACVSLAALVLPCLLLIYVFLHLDWRYANIFVRITIRRLTARGTTTREECTCKRMRRIPSCDACPPLCFAMLCHLCWQLYISILEHSWPFHISKYLWITGIVPWSTPSS
jgi:hypothetical protein